MEWLRTLLEGAAIKEGKLDVDSIMETINTEFPKNAVPKDTFNNLNDQLKTANKTISDLKKNNKDNETLQQTIQQHEATISSKEKELTSIRKETHLKDAFRKAGANEKYIDLLMKDTKLDDISEVNGEYVGADKIVTSVQESYKDLFNNTEDNDKEDQTYTYNPGNGNSGDAGSASFLDIIHENQARK